MLDGNARLNLATFVTTWMEPEAELLMAECAPKNMIDKDEYPQTAELEQRCVNILGSLWHAPRRARRSAARRPARARRACWAGWRCCGAGAPRRKAAGQAHRRGRTWSWAPTSRSAGRSSAATGTSSRASCRWRAAGTTSARPRPRRCATRTRSASWRSSGSTIDGSYEPVDEINAALDALAATPGGPDVPIHVDGASGGFIAPFLAAGAGVGLPAAAGRVDQHLGAQVRPGLPGRRLGHLARRGARCPRSWSSRSTTSAARCRRSR